MTNEVQQAREALGYRLGDIRKDARVSGRQLAALAGWHFTKVSKIEHGRSMPSDADIELWCFHCGAESQIADLTAAARGIEKMYVELKRLLRAGTARYQQELLDEETRTRHFRIFDPAIIPGALQTPGYATVRISEFADMVGIPTDLAATVAVRPGARRLSGRESVLAADSGLPQEPGRFRQAGRASARRGVPARLRSVIRGSGRGEHLRLH